MAADFTIASLDDVQELVREHGGEPGLRVKVSGLSHLGDAPSVLDWLDLVSEAGTTTGWEVIGMEVLRVLSTAVECLREVDGDLDHLADHLRAPAIAASDDDDDDALEDLLEDLSRHCNSAVIWAPRAIEKEARVIGLLGQDLMRDLRDGFAPEQVPEYITRAEALQQQITDFLNGPIVF